jgi:O-antigen/teichoic acid export membrane protein
MSTRTRTLTQTLTYAGTLPFALLLLPDLPVVGDTTMSLFAAYGAIIATFMAGTHWGMVQRDPQPDMTLLVISNAVALACWVCLIMPVGRLTLAVELVLFIALLALEGIRAPLPAEKPWYWRMRMRVTAIVCVFFLTRIVIG